MRQAGASWKGFLKVGELGCPVALYAAASTSERLAFHTLNRATGHRVRRVFVDQVTGEPVERDEQVKGYETTKDEHVVLTASGDRFVVQKHAARRLHYDFRLEMDGVLKSWAVTRGPSLVAGEKRLAVHVEDHPLDYGGFEGTIPKGEYGGGTVLLWDRGRWTPIGDARKGYAKGHLEFELAGEKLKGRWHLVRMQGKPGETRARFAVKLTHPDRVYWPDAGVTKEGLADYYAGVWRRIAPFVVARPLSLLRCPGGTAETCFFQKHLWKGANEAIRSVPDPGAPAEEPLVVIDDLDGLIGLVQAGVLEIHPWGSALADIERPDIIILDLDPGEGVGWEEIVAAARAVKERLEAVGLAAFVKTSGGKGVHVVSPLQPKADWAAAKAFSKGIAAAMAKEAPDRFVATVSKAERRGRNVWDNAAMESFFSSLKTERIGRTVYRTRDDARADVFDYIERFYNPVRRHSTLGYLSPMEYERQALLA